LNTKKKKTSSPRRSWNEWFKDTSQWIDEHNRMPNFKSTDLFEKKLASWCKVQRQFFRTVHGPERQEKLRSIGIVPCWKPRGWAETLQLAVAFKNRTGRWPIKYTDDTEEVRLAHWRNTNKSLLDRGKLNPNRAKQFRAAGLHRNVKDDAWFSVYERILDFMQKYDRLPSRHGNITKDEYTLGRWRNGQNARRIKGELEDEKRELFESAGLDGNIQDRNWLNHLKHVVQFHKTHERMPITDTKDPYERSLANWRLNQRSNVRNEKYITQQKKSLLSSGQILSGYKTKRDIRREEMHEKVMTFYNTYGRLPIERSSIEEKKLYVWYRSQLYRLRDSKLNGGWEEKIKKIQGLVQLPEDRRWRKWLRNYDRFAAFAQTNGRFPKYSTTDTSERNLYNWFSKQQKNLFDTSLNKKASILEDLPENDRESKKEMLLNDLYGFTQK